MMRKIALRGLLGRKRDTLLLWSVVTLAFLFLSISSTLITSLRATDAAQRIQTYGSWQVMASGLDAETSAQLSELAETTAVLPLVPVSGSDYFNGDNSYYLSVYTPELAQLGQFHLMEGHWPEARNEVVLEYARMESIGLEVGDTFTVSCRLEMPATDEKVAKEEARAAELREQAKAGALENYLEMFRSGEWNNTVGGEKDTVDIIKASILPVERRLFSWWENNKSSMGDIFPEDMLIPIEEMTEEQFRQVAEWWVNVSVNELSLTPYMTEEEKAFASANSLSLLGLDELIIRAEAESFLLNVQLQYTYTVCGVIETYTDRWDSGQTALPGGFVTEDNYQLLMGGQQTALEAYPGYETVEFETIELLHGGEETTASGLWEAALEPYNALVEKKNGGVILPWLRSYSGDVYAEQLGFSFYLGDPETESTAYVEGWLVPGTPLPEDSIFQTDSLLTYDAYDGLHYSFTVVLDQITESMEDYEHLDLGGFDYWVPYDLDGAVVKFELDGELFEIPWEEFRTGTFTVNGMFPVPDRYIWPGSLESQSDYTPLRMNFYAYPSSVESGESLLLLVMGILFVITVCAVFQICFTQIRRRLRRIVLMKSVGAETRQIAQMLGWEFLYFWVTALPSGTALGMACAWIVTSALERVQGRQILLTVEPAVLLAALAAGTAALLLGLAVPMIMAVGVPLTGRTTRKKPLPAPKKETRQTFFRITLRRIRTNLGRAVGSFALCAFIMLVSVLCLFLGFQLLGEYRETVVRDGKPDYLLRSPYAMGILQRQEYLEELEELGVCGDIESYFVGVNMELDRAAWEGSPLLTVAAGEADSYPVSLYTFYSDDALFEAYNAAATAGKLDAERFDAGQEVLLIVPLYRDTGRVNAEALRRAEGWDLLAASGVETSYYKEAAGIYAKDSTVQVGDTITLRRTTTTISGESYAVNNQEAAVTVGAILYYFPDLGIWPVSGSGEGYQIVAGPKLLSALLPNACVYRQLDSARAIYYARSGFSAMDNDYGSTDFYIKAAEGADLNEVDTALLIFARNHYMDLEVYHESNEKLLQDAVNNILQTCLLGLTALLLAVLILYNTIVSDLEQERRHIGILQALGVSHKQFMRRQLCLGLAAAGIALLLANGLLWGGVAVYAAVSGALLQNLLWNYPTAAHVVLCLVLAGIMILLYLAPMVRLQRYLPIENIKSRK